MLKRLLKLLRRKTTLSLLLVIGTAVLAVSGGRKGKGGKFAAPENVVATNGEHEGLVRITWTISSKKKIQRFLVQRSEDSESFTTIATVKTSVFTYDDTTVVAGQQYSYRVASYKKNKPEAPSEPDTGWSYVPPTATPQTAALNEDDAAGVTLSGSASWGTLSYAIVDVPANGTLTGTPPAVTYTPDPDYNGSDSFTFTVNDGRNESAPATVGLAINDVNDAPTAADLTASVNERESVAITLQGADIDDTPINYLIVDAPVNGTLGGTPPAVTYTPAPDMYFEPGAFTGEDSFTYITDDGELQSGLATVGISVINVNDAPVAVPTAPARVELTTPVVLSAEGSYDPDNGQSIVEYEWTQVAGEPVELDLTDPAHPVFTPVRTGVYEFALTVVDELGLASANLDNTVTVAIFAVTSPPAPHLTSPAPLGDLGGSPVVVETHFPVFSWESVAVANPYPELPLTYHLWVVDLTTGKSIISRTGIAGTSYTPTSPIPPGHSYYARVRAAVGGIYGSWSNQVDFDTYALAAPTLLSPAGTTSDPQPSLEWSGQPEGTTVDLWLIDATDGITVVIAENLSGTSYSPTTSLVPNHSYDVRLRARRAGFTSEWGAAQSFSVAPLSAPVLTSPSHALTESQPTLAWEALPAGSTVDLWLIDTTASKTVVYAEGLVGTSYTPANPLVPGHEYNLRLRARCSGFVSDWGDYSLSAPALVAPALVSPAGAIDDLRPTLVWEALPAGTTVDLWLIDTTTNKTAAYVENLSGTSFALASDLVPGHGYSVQLRAKLGGRTTSWSTPFSFSVAAVTPPALTSPTGTISELQPTLEWGTLASGTTVEIWLIDTTIGKTAAYAKNLTGTGYALPHPLTAGHAYSAQLRARRAGVASAWSQPQTFSVE